LVADTATVIATIGVIAAVVAALVAVVALYMQVKSLRVQMQALTRQLRSANYEQIVASFDDFSKTMIDHPELHGYLYGNQTVPDNDSNLRVQVDWFIGRRFVWFETVLVQYREYQLLSEDIVDHWLRLLKYELTFPAMRNHWDNQGKEYHEDLRSAVERILKNPAT
jgi:hypothetical protein